MVRSYVYNLKPTKKQAQKLDHLVNLCRYLYNAALEQRISVYRSHRKALSLYDQHKELTKLRAEDPVFREASAWILRSALARLDLAYKGFFRRVKAGETPGFPRFRGKDRYKSFSFPKPVVEANRVTVPNLGSVKFHKHREIPAEAELLEASIRKTPSGKWKLALVLNLGEAPAKKDIRTSTGIDLGLESFAVLADGQVVENPRFYRKSQEPLAKRQQKLAAKVKGSKSRDRAKVLVAKAHEKIKNQRKNHAVHITKALVAKYDLIVHEDLNIKGMARGSLDKSIHDASWNTFIHWLSCKAEEAGKTVVAVNPRGTSQTCSGCGKKEKKALSEREHSCEHCGLRLGRDHNAAINIHRLGLSLLQLSE